MKWWFCLFILLSGCKDNKESVARPTKEKTVYFPYVARKETRQGGSDENVLTVLKYWKLFESGNLKAASTLFCDTVKVVLYSSNEQLGKEEGLAKLQKERNVIEYAQCHIDFWQKTIIDEQPAVLIWAQVEGTQKGGRRSSYAVHQVWIFNSRGLIHSMQEYKSSFNW
jgi:hypothetical protein